jgi:hypothetical protein
MNPDHLLDQADHLINTSNSGAPRQADLRRAVSAAYYALFHCAIRAVCDLVLGKTAPKDSFYDRAYRALDHRDLKERSEEARSKGIISANVKPFADAVIALQGDRHMADYNPLFRISKSDALVKVAMAKLAIQSFEKAPPDERKAYLVTLLFKRRS